ncbi:hypothetical protein ACLOJK_018923 [Asimina triloba]
MKFGGLAYRVLSDAISKLADPWFSEAAENCNKSRREENEKSGIIELSRRIIGFPMTGSETETEGREEEEEEEEEEGGREGADHHGGKREDETLVLEKAMI